MDQHHDRVDALALEHRHELVGGLHLVGELQPGDAAGGDDARGVLEGHPDEADLRAVHVLDGVRRKDRLVGPGVLHVRGQVVELRALEGVVGAGVLVVRAVRAVVDAAAAGHPLELLVALVELVVADGGDVEAELVHRLDGRLVVERGGEQRRGADDVAGRDGQGVAGGPCGPGRGGWRGTPRRRRRPSRRPACRSPGRSRGRRRCGPTTRSAGSRLPWKSLNDSSWMGISAAVVVRPGVVRAVAVGGVGRAWCAAQGWRGRRPRRPGRRRGARGGGVHGVLPSVVLRVGPRQASTRFASAGHPQRRHVWVTSWRTVAALTRSRAELELGPDGAPHDLRVAPPPRAPPATVRPSSSRSTCCSRPGAGVRRTEGRLHPRPELGVPHRSPGGTADGSALLVTSHRWWTTSCRW